MCRLRPEKGHRRHAARRAIVATAENFTAVAEHAAWNVDRNARQSGTIDRADHGAHFRPERAREPGAEQRVDDQRRAVERGGAEGNHHAVAVAPAPRVHRGVAAHLARKLTDAHRPAEIAQMPGDDIAVAAVVAGTAQHGHRLRRKARGNRRRRHTAGGLHQGEAANAGFDRQPIRRGHLGDAQDRELIELCHSRHTGFAAGWTELLDIPTLPVRTASSQEVELR